MSQDIRFRPSAKEKILEEFGKTVDEDGYIIDSETRKRETSNLGNELTLDDLGGIGKGSTVFIEDDFVSVCEFVENQALDEE